jgi:YD repeat-containing protein
MVSLPSQGDFFYFYDLRGRLTFEKTPLPSHTSYFYDAADNLTLVKDSLER